MPDPSAAPGIDRASTKRRRNPFRRWWVWGLLIAVLVVVSGVAALAANALTVRNELQAALPLAAELKTKATTADIEGAKKVQTQIEEKLHTSSRIVAEPLWGIGEAVPWAGSNFTAVRELVQATNTLMSDAIGPLVDIAATTDPASFAPVDGAINTEPLTDAVPRIASANAAVKKALASVRDVDTSGTLEQVAAAKSQLAAVLAELEGPLETLDAIVPLLGPALGTEAPRTYAVMFQNNAESRALGGTALSFAVVKVDGGRIELTEALPAGFANFTQYPASVVPIPDGAEDVYPKGTYGTFIANSTLRPSFVSTAEMVQEFWRLQFGTELDGILSVDPTALSYFLRATGPLPLSTGDVLTSESLVPLILNEVYQRFDSGNLLRDNIAQDLFYAEVVDTTFSALMAGPLDPPALLGALSQGWDERRVLYWSAHEDEQAQLEAIGLNGELPLSDETTERFGVYFQDHVGSKLNYHLNQSVRVAASTCDPSGNQTTRVSVDLTNTVAQADVKTLSKSILGQYVREKLKPGVQRMVVLMYAPPGSTITGATVDGAPKALDDLHDTEYPVGKMIVSVNPGETVSLSFEVTSGSPGAKDVDVQTTPMVNPTTVAKEELDCSTINAG